MVLLITYDKTKLSFDWDPLHDAIKAAGTWWHHLPNVWIVDTTESPSIWTSRIKGLLPTNASLLIIEVTDNRQGILPKTAWKWLQNRNY